MLVLGCCGYSVSWIDGPKSGAVGNDDGMAMEQAV